MSIISISGKKGNGKDTVGKIMQIMIDMPHFKDEAIISFLDRDFPNPSFEIKKFAYKLKKVTATLLGCSMRQLEDEKFKNTPLGEEWWYYKGETQLFPYQSEELFKANTKLPLITMTPRLFLQLLGTECGRQILHPNIWINSLMSEYNSRSNWIITDLRFPDEAKAVKEKGSVLIRVNRDTEAVLDEHPSETALDDYKDWDFVINNNGSLQDLVKECRTILTSLKLLKYKDTWQE